jgi:phosphate transport system substrate-binding protein
VNWPGSDKIVAAPKNDGVTATVKQTPGAIGYIEYAYALGAKVEMAELQNKDGKFVRPSAESGEAALATQALAAFSNAFCSGVKAPGRPLRGASHKAPMPFDS